VQREGDLGLGIGVNLSIRGEQEAARDLRGASGVSAAAARAGEGEERRRTSMRGTLCTPAARRMDTAFVDQAVVKFSRGPSSRIHVTLLDFPASCSMKELRPKPDGSNVSRRQ